MHLALAGKRSNYQCYYYLAKEAYYYIVKITLPRRVAEGGREPSLATSASCSILSIVALSKPTDLLLLSGDSKARSACELLRLAGDSRPSSAWLAAACGSEGS